MAKPIFIIRAPKSIGVHSERIYEHINQQLADDYHVLVVADSPDEEFRFHCFNSNLTEIDLETLKELVMVSILKRENEAI